MIDEEKQQSPGADKDPRSNVQMIVSKREFAVYRALYRPYQRDRAKDNNRR